MTRPEALRPYQQCTRCLMDTSDPEIVFDEQGRCNHCTRYFSRIAREIAPAGEREARLAAVVALFDRLERRDRGWNLADGRAMAGGAE